jgi:CrcB protein
VKEIALWLGVALLGGTGAVARFVCDDLVSWRTGRAFPWGILAVNVSGAFVLGLLTGLALHGDALLLAGTALLGAFTTFSTWMVDTVELARVPAVLNVAGSLALGIGAVLLGRALA